MKQFIIDDSFWALFPSAQFGVVAAKNIDNTFESTKSKMGRLKSSLAAGCVQTGKYLAKENINDNKVVKIWTDAYKKFASDENAEASVVTLLKTAHNTGNVDSVNALMDICNSDSLIWALPITAFDTDKIAGDLHLGTFNDDLCFYDSEGALSAAWSYSFADRAKVTYETKNAVLMINLIDTTRVLELKACLNTLVKQPVSYVGAESSSFIINTDNKKGQL